MIIIFLIDSLLVVGEWKLVEQMTGRKGLSFKVQSAGK